VIALHSGTTKGRLAIAAALRESNVKTKFTPELVRSLERHRPTDRAECFIYDTEVRGWGIRILKSGTASWITQATVRGKMNKRKSYARVDRLPFTLARERAREILALAELGRDWYAEQAAQAAAEQAAEDAEGEDKSLGAKLENYLADPEIKKLRSFDQIERCLRKLWAPLHGESAETITSKRITEHLERVAVDRGIVAANRARSKLHSAFEWLLATHRLERDDNPAARARKWREARRRNRAPSLQELGAIWKACGEVYPETFGAIVRLLLLTGARKSEIALLAKAEIDLEAAEITLPPTRTKTGEWHVIPLSRPGLRILQDLPERRSARIFPAVSWHRCKAKLDAASGVTGYTLHDFRRSFSSLARDELHAHGELVELCLGHLPGGVRGRYDFGQRKAERRQLLEGWARLILVAAGEPVDEPELRVIEGGGR
jgi:integrase